MTAVPGAFGSGWLAAPGRLARRSGVAASLPFPVRGTPSTLALGMAADKQQVERALGGDTEAAAAVVRELLPVIQRRVARALVLSGRCRAEAIRQEVEDLSQDILLLLLTGESPLRGWDPLKGLSLKNFVGLIAQRRVLAVLASRRRSPFSSEPTDPSDLGSLTDAQASPPDGARLELERLALQLRERLSPRGLEMFYRLYVWQESPSEIASATGQQVEAIYQWRSRIRKQAVELREAEAEESATAQHAATPQQGAQS